MLNCKHLTSPAIFLALAGDSSALTVALDLAASSDPASAQYTVSAFAIGDWGATTYKGSCCGSSSNNYDLHAQETVATLMDIEAGSSGVPVKVVVGHGDSFYWTGINSLASRDGRFAASYEAKYDGANIKNVPWVNVMGNHDYGGSDYICSVGDTLVKCNTTEELFRGLENKLRWQSGYTSPNDDRWNMNDHFYVYRIEDANSGVSVDIFNVETNDADIHGADLICCQCYGYAGSSATNCNNVVREDPKCFGGNLTMFDSCMAKFAQWGSDSRAQLAKKVAVSNATWKLVNSHFSPYEHYKEPGMNKWFDVLRNSGVRAFLHGHTHGEKHDYAESLGVHFVENGAGGGRQKGAASTTIQAYAAPYVKNEWSYTPTEYGFFSLQASTDWLKLQYHTTDSKWAFAEKFEESTIGGVETKHCWYIPADGSEGRAC